PRGGGGGGGGGAGLRGRRCEPARGGIDFHGHPPAPPRYGGLRLLFDGGRLDSAEAGRLVLPGPELRDWRFVTEQEAAELLPPVRYERLRWALRARERGAALYLEAGVPVG
ncbi:hypothetical protein ACFV23_04385, partial [Streptomyces sp. NPDC059627]